MNRRLYALHRWVSAVAFIQLGLWTLTGAFFAIVPIERVRGEGLPNVHHALLTDEALIPPSVLLEGWSGQRPYAVELRAQPAGTFYIVRSHDGTAQRFDARTGKNAPVSESEARATARRDQAGSPPVRSSTWLTESPGPELRGKPLPVWRVELEDGEGTVVYVDGRTGEIAARRNDLWRWYDFLWSLHIMDYEERESFNHPLLVFFAALAVLTVVSGLVLWGTRLLRRLARRRHQAG